jgi:hypothetical protein
MSYKVAVIVDLPDRSETPWGATSYPDAIDWTHALINVLEKKSKTTIDYVVYTVVQDYQHDEQGRRVLTLPPEIITLTTEVKPDAHEVGGFTD